MNKIIETAQKEIGTKENPKNSNIQKYGEWFGLNGVPWCAIFVSWVYHQSGNPLPNIGFAKGFAGCQTAVKYFKENGLVVRTPVEGDLVFFDWNYDDRFDHVGIFVRRVNELLIETIEGNTSLSNQSNGGAVMRRNRNFAKCLFVSPFKK